MSNTKEDIKTVNEQEGKENINEAELKEENKMGTMPMWRLIRTISLPMVISMLVQALYNIVDSVFVSYFDADAND